MDVDVEVERERERENGYGGMRVSRTFRQYVICVDPASLCIAVYYVRIYRMLDMCGSST